MHRRAHFSWFLPNSTRSRSRKYYEFSGLARSLRLLRCQLSSVFLIHAEREKGDRRLRFARIGFESPVSSISHEYILFPPLRIYSTSYLQMRAITSWFANGGRRKRIPGDLKIHFRNDKSDVSLGRVIISRDVRHVQTTPRVAALISRNAGYISRTNELTSP